MAPDQSDGGSADHEYVICASCGAKAATSWSFCRSCQSSLDDAQPPEAGIDEDLLDMQASGCPKCGHEDAEVDEITTTGGGFSKLLDVQNRRFKAVSCSNCGYTEFYRGQDADVIVDLFLGG